MACQAPEGEQSSPTGAWLALLNDFRTFDWAEEYKYPTVVLDQMKGLPASRQVREPVAPDFPASCPCGELCAKGKSFGTN